MPLHELHRHIRTDRSVRHPGLRSTRFGAGTSVRALLEINHVRPAWESILYIRKVLPSGAHCLGTCAIVKSGSWGGRSITGFCVLLVKSFTSLSTNRSRLDVVTSPPRKAALPCSMP